MYFKNLNFKNKLSTKESLNINDDDITSFVTMFNTSIIEKDSKTLALAELDNMTKKEQCVFCYLAIVGFEHFLNKKIGMVISNGN